MFDELQSPSSKNVLSLVGGDHIVSSAYVALIDFFNEHSTAESDMSIFEWRKKKKKLFQLFADAVAPRICGCFLWNHLRAVVRSGYCFFSKKTNNASHWPRRTLLSAFGFLFPISAHFRCCCGPPLNFFRHFSSFFGNAEFCSRLAAHRRQRQRRFANIVNRDNPPNARQYVPICSSRCMRTNRARVNSNRITTYDDIIITIDEVDRYE